MRINFIHITLDVWCQPKDLLTQHHLLIAEMIPQIGLVARSTTSYSKNLLRAEV